MKFEPYVDLVDQAFAQSNENAINNKDSHSQIEIDERPAGEYPNENYSEDTETTKTSAIPNFMSQTLRDYEITEGISYLFSMLT